jgi:hypothetical protein
VDIGASRFHLRGYWPDAAGARSMRACPGRSPKSDTARWLRRRCGDAQIPGCSGCFRGGVRNRLGPGIAIVITGKRPTHGDLGGWERGCECGVGAVT